MNDTTKSHKTQITIAIIGVVGVLGAALIANFEKLFPSDPIINEYKETKVTDLIDAADENRISNMQIEITYRLQEIRKFLYQDQMTNRSLYSGTQRLTAHGVGISAEFKNTELRTLLFELSQLVPENKRPPIENVMVLFDELATIGPHAPFMDAEKADPIKVTSARNKFSQIEREWLRSM